MALSKSSRDLFHLMKVILDKGLYPDENGRMEFVEGNAKVKIYLSNVQDSLNISVSEFVSDGAEKEVFHTTSYIGYDKKTGKEVPKKSYASVKGRSYMNEGALSFLDINTFPCDAGVKIDVSNIQCENKPEDFAQMLFLNFYHDLYFGNIDTRNEDTSEYIEFFSESAEKKYKNAADEEIFKGNVSIDYKLRNEELILSGLFGAHTKVFLRKEDGTLEKIEEKSKKFKNVKPEQIERINFLEKTNKDNVARMKTLISLFDLKKEFYNNNFDMFMEAEKDAFIEGGAFKDVARFRNYYNYIFSNEECAYMNRDDVLNHYNYRFEQMEAEKELAEEKRKQQIQESFMMLDSNSQYAITGNKNDFSGPDDEIYDINERFIEKQFEKTYAS